MAKRRPRRTNRSPRQLIARETDAVVDDFNRTFKKALKVMAVLIALVVASKELGGLSIPIHLDVHLHLMPTSEPEMTKPKTSRPSREGKMPVTTIRLEDAAVAALDAEAAEKRTTRSAHIRDVLDAHLSRSAASRTQTPPGADAISSAEIADLREQLGIVRGLALNLCDLATQLRDGQVGQNHVLDAFFKDLVQVANKFGVYDPPCEPSKVDRFIKMHLDLKKKSQ